MLGSSFPPRHSIAALILNLLFAMLGAAERAQLPASPWHQLQRIHPIALPLVPTWRKLASRGPGSTLYGHLQLHGQLVNTDVLESEGHQTASSTAEASSVAQSITALEGEEGGRYSGGPTDSERRATAADILTVLSGGSLRNSSWDRQLKSSLLHGYNVPKPPSEWQQLCRAASAGGHLAIEDALGWRRRLVPDIEGSSRARCQLTSSRRGRRFRSRALNKFMAALFECIHRGTATGNSQVALSRFDLFHAHIFQPHGLQGLGLLFHAAEYPAFSPEFAVHLGYCQTNSTVAYEEVRMDQRNIIYYEGNLAVVDVGPTSVLHTKLLMPGLEFVKTVIESDFGARLVDVNYFHSLSERRPAERLFVCK